ncbi:unnamed protein product [Prunus brigantina]
MSLNQLYIRLPWELTRLIIAIVKAYVEGDKPMLDLFLDGFWHGEGTRGLISQLLLLAVDQTSFERCKFLHLHCHKLEADDPADFEAEKLYMFQDFINMMWRRTLFLKEMLERGYTLQKQKQRQQFHIFDFFDVMWLRNPFPGLISFNESIYRSSNQHR